jgi:hypothetical protein
MKFAFDVASWLDLSLPRGRGTGFGRIVQLRDGEPLERLQPESRLCHLLAREPCTLGITGISENVSTHGFVGRGTLGLPEREHRLFKFPSHQHLLSFPEEIFRALCDDKYNVRIRKIFRRYGNQVEFEGNAQLPARKMKCDKFGGRKSDDAVAPQEFHHRLRS